MSNLKKCISRVFLLIFLVQLTMGIPVFEKKASADVTTGLIAQWKFNEDTGTVATDSSGFARNATFTFGSVGGRILESSGNGHVGNGSAMNFDGTMGTTSLADGTTATIGGGALNLLGTTDFTITAWVKPGTTMGTVSGYILGCSSATSGAGGTGLGINAGKIALSCVNNYDILTSSAVLTCDGNTWAHIAITYNASSSTVKFYKDGDAVPNAAITSSSHPVSAEGVLSDLAKNKLARATDRMGLLKSNKWYQGALDELRIYNSTLSQEQIAEVKNSIDPPPPPPANANTNVSCTNYDFNALASLTGTIDQTSDNMVASLETITDDPHGQSMVFTNDLDATLDNAYMGYNGPGGNLAGKTTLEFAIRSNVNNPEFYLTLFAKDNPSDSLGTITEFFRISNTGTMRYSDLAFTQDTWYNIRYDFNLNANPVTYDFYINGQKQNASPIADDSIIGGGESRKIRFSVNLTEGQKVYIDDLKAKRSTLGMYVATPTITGTIAAGQNISASTQITNYLNNSLGGNVAIILACFDSDHKLLKVDFRELTVISQDSLSVPLNDLPTGTSYAKAFLWDGIDTMTPIVNPVTK